VLLLVRHLPAQPAQVSRAALVALGVPVLVLRLAVQRVQAALHEYLI
jgi:hypothetical protein